MSTSTRLPNETMFCDNKNPKNNRQIHSDKSNTFRNNNRNVGDIAIKLTFPEIWVESFCENSEDEDDEEGDNQNNCGDNIGGKKKAMLSCHKTAKDEFFGLRLCKDKVIRSLLTSSTDVSFESQPGSTSSTSSSRQNSFQLNSRENSVDRYNDPTSSSFPTFTTTSSTTVESPSLAYEPPAVDCRPELFGPGRDQSESSEAYETERTIKGEKEEEEEEKCCFDQFLDFHTPVASAIDDWLKRLERNGFTSLELSCVNPDEVNYDEEDDTWFEEGLARIFDPYYDLELKDIRCVEEGKVSKTGFPVGRCIVKLNNGDELYGSFRNGGQRFGRGSIEGDNLLKHGVVCISGLYQDSLLTGMGRAMLAEGAIWPSVTKRLHLHGMFREGYLEGPVYGLTEKGELIFAGGFRKGLPSGCCWLAREGQGWLYGKVDEKGRFSGPDIAFLAPNKRTCMVGLFHDEVMLKAHAGHVSQTRLNEFHVLCLDITVGSTDSSYYSSCPSNKDKINCDWLLPDCYEAVTVACEASKINGAGEGLFAQTNIPEGKVIAYYNGIRVKAGESYNTRNFDYQIYVDWANTDGSPFVDVPLECTDMSVYKASLAHKANHSFDPNCQYVAIEHPRFGRIPGLMTIREVRKGDELFSHYKYDMALAPGWYQKAWEDFNDETQ